MELCVVLVQGRKWLMSSQSMELVAIIDHGTGNLFSVQQACEQVGLLARITRSPEEILSASMVILPGVGAFGEAMESLSGLGLVDPLRKVAGSGIPLVGICLGMQLLMSESHEFGHHSGLGIVEGEVLRMEEANNDVHYFKVPQVGWNRIYVREGMKENEKGLVSSLTNGLLTGVGENAFMYFVHSYYCKPVDEKTIYSTTQYGDFEFCSSLRQGNVYGFQFHPEKSGSAGINIYRNLARMIQ